MSKTNINIGYYAHHMGSGHATRANTLLSNWSIPSTLLTSYPLQNKSTNTVYQFVQLPEDHAHLSNYDQSIAPEPEVFHHAPLGVDQIRARMNKISTFFEDKNPNFFITDVSAEMTQFARLCSVPAISFRLTGNRNDLAHMQAYQSSHATIFPLPKIFEHPETPQWLIDKTLYVGGICRHKGKYLSSSDARKQLGINNNQFVIVFTNGLYDNSTNLPSIIKIAEKYPKKLFVILGKYEVQEQENFPNNIYFAGRVADTYPYLRAANIVVGSCGNNTMLEVAHAERPFICVPEERPYEEQISKAKVLEELDVAVVSYDFPTVHSFDKLLKKAMDINPKNLTNLFDHNAVKDIERYILELCN